jgi:hypothetical protein
MPPDTGLVTGSGGKYKNVRRGREGLAVRGSANLCTASSMAIPALIARLPKMLQSGQPGRQQHWPPLQNRR